MSDSHAPPLLRVRDLTTRFYTRRGVVHAVNNVSFDVGHGEIVGIVGETGCGKSATIRSILGLLPPPGKVIGGSAHFNDTDLIGLGAKDLRRIRGSRIGFVAQHPWSALNPILPIRDQFRNIITSHRKAADEECDAIALAALQNVQISGAQRVLQGYAHELSGGMAQRVVIAMAMVLEPSLVIADEPTTALDVTVQREILNLIRSLIASGHRSMLLITHDLGIVAQYCESVVVMYAGKVVESGPVRPIFRAPGHPYTEALLKSIPRVGQPLIPLHGRVPDLMTTTPGCPYVERCAYAVDRCLIDAPDLRSVGSGRFTSCHVELIERTPDDAPH